VQTTVTGGSGSLDDGDARTGAHADADAEPATDVFHELNNAYAEPVVIRVRAGRAIVEPIIVTHTISGDGVAVFPRLVIEAGQDSEVTVVERFLSSDGERSLVVPRLELRAGQAARVRYLGVNMLNTATWQIGHQRAIGGRDSNTLLATVALGGDYARVRTDARLVGQGGTTRQIALYYADTNQMHDFRTLQDHAAPRTNSDLLFKGAVQDHAKSVYTGLIKIRHEAKGSVAFQTNRNLTLSEGAWAESVPNLDIDTNDVKCSHASTIGPIDEEQRFYLESRGIPPEVAERLVVLGFFDEVLEQMPVGAFAADLRREVGAKLARRQPTEERS
jgi:Fe-S cluster assembly protein SufD